jgi:hypothetical protein
MAENQEEKVIQTDATKYSQVIETPASTPSATGAVW